MLYSWMSEGSHAFISLHGEQVLRDVRESAEQPDGDRLMTETLSLKTVKRIAEHELSAESLFIDFAHIYELEEGAAELLFDVIAALSCGGTEVYLADVAQNPGKWLEEKLCETGTHFEKKRMNGEKCVFGIGTQEKPEAALEKVSARMAEICRDNLLILVEDSPAGKQLDCKRLLEDGEHCLYYFFYRLAMKIREAGLLPAGEKDLAKVSLVPGNEQAVFMAEELARLLRVEAEGQELSRDKIERSRDYILVRDVVHFAGEAERGKARILAAGARALGAVCLLDIHTGIGRSGKGVSLHTLNLEKKRIYRKMGR